MQEVLGLTESVHQNNQQILTPGLTPLGNNLEQLASYPDEQLIMWHCRQATSKVNERLLDHVTFDWRQAMVTAV